MWQCISTKCKEILSICYTLTFTNLDLDKSLDYVHYTEFEELVLCLSNLNQHHTHHHINVTAGLKMVYHPHDF